MMNINIFRGQTVIEKLLTKCNLFLRPKTRLKSYYVTTPIFYVNSRPHLGHLYTATLADTAGRWEMLKQEVNASRQGVVFASGTDEHGKKIYEAALKAGYQPQEFCDNVSQKYKDLYEACDIGCTDFIRTTDNKHKTAVQAFWNILEERGFIYKGSYEGWYSTQDETFLSEKNTTMSKGERVSMESGHRVEWMKEKNHIFRLSAVLDEVRSWAEQNPECIYPAKFHKYFLDSLDSSIGDISISRDRSRVPWGIEVPSDPNQTVYVWLDALVNYLTVAGFPDVNGKRFKDTWPADCHIIGHDIIKFHALYWPAFLIAAGLELPKQILVHSHWLKDGCKMSKSIGNVVDPLHVAGMITGERLKYFLLKQGVLEHDCDFSRTLLLQAVNGDLCNSLGNCLNRAVAPKINPEQIYPPFYEECYARLIMPRDSSEEPPDLVMKLQKLPDQVHQFCEDFHFYKAIEQIMDCVREANVLIHRNQIWNLDLSNKEEKKLNDTAIHCVYETLRVCGIFLQPFTPSIAKGVLNRLNVQPHERTLKMAGRAFYHQFSDDMCPMTGRKLGPSEGLLVSKIKRNELDNI